MLDAEYIISEINPDTITDAYDLDAAVEAAGRFAPVQEREEALHILDRIARGYSRRPACALSVEGQRNVLRTAQRHF